MASGVDPSIQGVGGASPHYKRGAGEVEHDEKKVASAEVSPSIQGVTAGTGWHGKLRSLFSVGPRPNRPHDSVYQPRAPLPAESASVWSKIWTFFRFLGPGAVISVAYVDPDNYQTAIASGSEFQYKLLFMVLVSNVIAIYVQSLCVKMGTVTGLDLAQMNHRHLPRWFELIIYVVAEASIIATDLGQVIGTAIALNILIPKLPLPAACVISVVETLLILLFYTDTGEIRRLRIFEMFVSVLVIVVFVTICVALGMVDAPAGPVFRGFLPSKEVFVDTGLYAMCAILGGTLMPHALYVGTALSKARLYEYDKKNHDLSQDQDGNTTGPASSTESLGLPTSPTYRPSLRAIKNCLGYSIAELSVTLFIVAVFVNSALIIIAGAAFYKPGADPDELSDDLYDLYDLFSDAIAPAAGIMFAVSLLFSGVSAGLVSTMAGQIVMEGALNIRVSPFLRRLITRCVAIIPALIIAVSVGKDGLSKALVACNYLLAIALIPITFPIVYYTCRAKYMAVPTDSGTGTVNLKNNWLTSGVAWLLWLLVVVMDVATIVLVAMGITKDEG